MVIEKNAPLQGKEKITIESPVERAWEVLTDINNWTEWQKDVSEAVLEGELKKGAKFSWKAGGMNIRSEIIVFEPMEKIGWKGDFIGVHAVHLWHLKKEGEKTVVQTEESLSGWLAKLISIFRPNFLEGSLKKSLLSLKQEIEE